MSDNRIMTQSELQALLTENLRDKDEKTIIQRKTNYMGVGRLLASVKMDIETAKFLGKPLFKRTKEYLEIK